MADYRFLDDPLIASVERAPTDVAIVGTDATLTYNEFLARVDELAGMLLALDLKPGDRVSILADNHSDYLAIHYATARTGIILHVLNVRLTPGEMAYAVNDAASQVLLVDDNYGNTDAFRQLLGDCSGIRCVVSFSDSVGLADRSIAGLVDAGQHAQTVPLSQRQPTDPVVLIYTSGTTGRPKGALQHHRGSLLADQIMGSAAKFDSSDVWLASMPYFHQAGLIRSRASIAAGGRNVILGRLNPDEVAAAVASHSVTIAMLVGGQLKSILSRVEASTGSSSLRMLITGGGSGSRGTAAMQKACQQLGC
jgi:acyl-CoA synthetase (AMP-forming)/AMP-acid ligase II